jgi:hypothetical protein
MLKTPNKPVLILIAACMFAASCKEITFRQPQPKGRKPLAAIPKEIQGRYLPLTEDGEVSRDTVVIFKEGYRFGYYEASDRTNPNDEEYESGVLSDSLVLKTFKGYYFFSFHENPEWTLRVVKREKNGDLIYMAPEQEGVDFKDYVKKISVEIPIDSSEVNGKTLYQIDPTPKQLVKLIEKGFFSRAVMKKVQ